MFTTENIKQTTVNIQRSKRKEPLIRLKEQSKRAKIKNKCALLKRAERKKRSKRNEQAMALLAPLLRCAIVRHKGVRKEQRAKEIQAGQLEADKFFTGRVAAENDRLKSSTGYISAADQISSVDYFE
ncbi:hypothetical protein EVAR_101641_1 [Eumeta japonica]|uniref:Uncharacterized protein n=1 Tax=Eumeta variegata TaxID=151549 RepID=A0A4C2AB96_EUMVA|nr:hypothetical protein EVAR_101641_1 [Eumeta japonica]